MLAPGSRVPTRPPTREEITDRLTAATRAWITPHEFKPYDLVRAAPFVAGYGPNARQDVEAMVVETCPSLREMCGEPNMPDGQGILIAFLSKDELHYGWYGAWQYVLSEPLPARALHA